MKELNYDELRFVNGGVSFAYRFGQLIRGIFMCCTAIGAAQFLGEVALNG